MNLFLVRLWIITCLLFLIEATTSSDIKEADFAKLNVKPTESVEKDDEKSVSREDEGHITTAAFAPLSQADSGQVLSENKKSAILVVKIDKQERVNLPKSKSLPFPSSTADSDGSLLPQSESFFQKLSRGWRHNLFRGQEPSFSSRSNSSSVSTNTAPLQTNVEFKETIEGDEDDVKKRQRTKSIGAFMARPPSFAGDQEDREKTLLDKNIPGTTSSDAGKDQPTAPYLRDQSYFKTSSRLRKPTYQVTMERKRRRKTCCKCFADCCLVKCCRILCAGIKYFCCPTKLAQRSSEGEQEKMQIRRKTADEYIEEQPYPRMSASSVPSQLVSRSEYRSSQSEQQPNSPETTKTLGSDTLLTEKVPYHKTYKPTLSSAVPSYLEQVNDEAYSRPSPSSSPSSIKTRNRSLKPEFFPNQTQSLLIGTESYTSRDEERLHNSSGGAVKLHIVNNTTITTVTTNTISITTIIPTGNKGEEASVSTRGTIRSPCQ